MRRATLELRRSAVTWSLPQMTTGAPNKRRRNRKAEGRAAEGEEDRPFIQKKSLEFQDNICHGLTIDQSVTNIS